MTYKITNYSKQKAKEYNVIIKLSTNKNKKLDVIKYNVVIKNCKYWSKKL